VNAAPLGTDSADPLTAEQVRLTAEQVRLFADPLRLRIVTLLAREELCTCHLVAETGAKQPTVSHHLRLLREAGVVEADPAGAYTYYRLRAAALAELGTAFTALADQAADPSRRRLPCD
jgi:ArsR family transcriptional regulator, arsenate/arsenite/antimonite-responsive transcriptional repressor